MITKQDIERVEALPQDKMVLMAVVNDNPAVYDNEGKGLHTRAKSMMTDAGVPPTIMNQVLADLDEARQSYGKSVVYVVGEDVFERFDVQADLTERYHYGRPSRAILMNVLDAMPRAGVLLLDRDWARFFILNQGELVEMRREENTGITEDGGGQTTIGTRGAPANISGSGSNQGSTSRNDLFQSYQDAQQQRFYNDMAGQLGKIMKDQNLKQLVLVGPDERVAAFRKEVPDSANFEIIGETNVNVGAGQAGEAEILEKITPIVSEFQDTEEARLMDRIQEQGVMEMERVLEMLQQARIYLMLIPGDGSQVNIYRSHNPEVPYFTSKKNVTESPADGSLMEQVTLEDCLPQFVDLYGVEIKRMHGDFSEKLVKDYGGLAGLTRY